MIGLAKQNLLKNQWRIF